MLDLPRGHIAGLWGCSPTGILSIDDIMLRALDQTNGVSSAEFIKALRRICSQPAVEPQVDLSDTFVSG